jgi:mono/diheme cytochrome c family protein
MEPTGRSSRRRRARLGVTAAAALACAALFLATARVGAVATTSAATGEHADARSTAFEAARSAQLERGAAVYDFSCTTCHGATGSGFAEARSAFPADHYDCTRCHMPLNPPQMTPWQIETTQSVFSLGDAPPLADGPALARFGTAGALHAYVRTTMPRWAPASLSDDAYLDVTAFVLHLAGLLPDGVMLEAEELAALLLVPTGD